MPYTLKPQPQPRRQSRLRPLPLPFAVYVLGLAVFAQGTSEFMLSGLVSAIATDLDVSSPPPDSSPPPSPWGWSSARP